MIETDNAPDTVRRVWREILEPSFPRTELVTSDELVDAVVAGVSDVVVAREGDELRGAAVGERYGGATLLAWIAVAPGARSGGVGGALLDAATARWSADPARSLILAEIERPDRHEAHERFGDPARRLAFYARRGAVALDLPYFQPSLAPGLPRPHGLLLIVLNPSVAAIAPGGALQGAGARAVVGFLEETIGAPAPGDLSAQALFARASDPGGIRVVALDGYAAIAASVA